MLLRYTGTSTLSSLDTGYGVQDVAPWDVILVKDDNNVLENNQSVFEKVVNTDALITKRVTLSSAEILALNSTPKTLVSAPWAWRIIDVESITAFVDYNSAAYATNTTIEFRYTNGSGAKVSADISNLLAATADKIITVRGVASEVVNVANAAVVAVAATWDPVTGNSPVYVTVRYRVSIV